MLNIHTQFMKCQYEMLKSFIRKPKKNPNLLFINEINWVTEEIGN